MGTTALLTVEDFSRLKTSDTQDFELVEGELVPLSSGTPQHGFIRDFLTVALALYFRQSPGGRTVAEIDCQLARDIVRRPDISVFMGEKAARIDPDSIPVAFAPDVAIEVLSASESAIDVNRKVREYLAAGSAEVWVVDHINGELFVHSKTGIRLLQAGDVLESELLPGFSVPAAEIFAGR
jgi:Uma2 family endonuclease